MEPLEDVRGAPKTLRAWVQCLCRQRVLPFCLISNALLAQYRRVTVDKNVDKKGQNRDKFVYPRQRWLPKVAHIIRGTSRWTLPIVPCRTGDQINNRIDLIKY